VVSLTSSSGGYINGRNSANLELLIDKTSSIYLYVKLKALAMQGRRNYSDFLKRHLHPRNRLLDQGYAKIRLIPSLKKCIFRYQDLVEIYSVSAETIINDAFSYIENV
jgi:hypothetical protein